jgi:hypothetical protein
MISTCGAVVQDVNLALILNPSKDEDGALHGAALQSID